MALFNTPSFNQRVAPLISPRVVEPLTDNTPQVPWYMTALQSDDHVIGGPLERTGLGGLVDKARSSVEQLAAKNALQKQYSNLVESKKYDRAGIELEKWLQVNPGAPTADATDYYRNVLDSLETRQLSRSRALRDLNSMILKIPIGRLRDAYAEQLRIIDQMHNGRNASDSMRWKPTAKARTNGYWDSSRSDSYTI